MKFSTRLVELHIEDIGLGYDAAIAPFMKAISSAVRLRDLKIISVITWRNPRATFDTKTLTPATFPNLQSLSLVGLYFNTLESLLPMITSSTCQVSLVLGHRSRLTHEHVHDGSVNNELTIHNLEIDSSNLCRVLKHTPVSSLTLFGTWWLSRHLFRDLLTIIPSLKTLNMDDCLLGRGYCRQIERDFNTEMQRPFPALETLRITRSLIYTEVFQEFKKMVASHPLRQVIMGVNVNHISSVEELTWKPLEEESELVNWLRTDIPVVRVVDYEAGVPEEYRTWRRW
ncbi:hypothetical protein B0J17DRAFT_710043 [Rhizoctonia solani]|nr:hypothetical protein B0J17DRAFT_710043 [Rhizoctonia solani]